MITEKSDLLEPRISGQYAGLGIALLMTGLIYYSGLSGGFLFDDYFNIVDNPAVYLEQLSFAALKNAAGSSESGMLKRPIAMLSFALNGYFGGITPGNLKAVNLVIHLINGVLVFLLTRLTLQCTDVAAPHAKNTWWPLIVAALWLTAPINLTGVLYAVQRMTSLATLFSFAGLCFYVELRIRHIAGKCGGLSIAAVLLLFTLLAALSKENGLLLPALAGCYELTVLRFKTPNRREKTKLSTLYFFICILPAGLLVFVLSTQPGTLLGGYDSIRDFTLAERLLTETRVLWLYLFWIVAPLSASLGLYHDDIPSSHSLLSPVSTLPALLGLMALLIWTLVIRKKQPLIALGILLFFTGHLMESTIIPLEIAHEHRNYFPSYGILLSITAAARQFLQNRGLIVMAASVIAFMAVTGVRASLWGNSLDLVLMEVQHHPLSPRSNHEAARLYTWLMDTEKRPAVKKNNYLIARRFFLKSSELEASHISGLIGAIWIDSQFGAAVDEKLVRLAAKRLSDQKITPSTSKNLSRLHNCEMFNNCRLSGELIYDLQLAVIGNSKTPLNIRVLLMSEASARALKLNRFQEALGIAYDAAKYSPDNAQLGLNYAALLIAAQLYDAAKTELDRVAKLQIEPGIMQRFEQLRALLAKSSHRSLVHSLTHSNNMLCTSCKSCTSLNT
ncbi:MAG: tetratricopeptide repeat protein [Methylococcales bacterium]